MMLGQAVCYVLVVTQSHHCQAYLDNAALHMRNRVTEFEFTLDGSKSN